MSIFSHDIYQNVRTRTLVMHDGCLLLHPPRVLGEEWPAWHLPGGGLEPHESLAECARREVLEETGIAVRVGMIAFVQEWVVPRYSQPLEPGQGHGYGLEVFHYAWPEEPVPPPRPEYPGQLAAVWVPLVEVPNLPLWPRELKELCPYLVAGRLPTGAHSFLGHLESPWTRAEHDPFGDLAR